MSTASYIEYMLSLLSYHKSEYKKSNETIENICMEANSLMEQDGRKSTQSVQLKKILTTLNTCRCCKRHQTNRPSLIDLEKGHNGDYPYSDTAQNDKIKQCNCSCRHTSRWIVRHIHK